jgi:hypothetical protein
MQNNRRTISRTALLWLVAAWPLAAEEPQSQAGPAPFKIFSGAPRLLIVNGYSTSAHWPDNLQRKLDRYFNGRRVIEVRKVIRGSTPIARWIDVQTGQPLPTWEPLRQALREKGDRPAIVLAQQSLQWVFGEREEGIRNEQDASRIQRGADALQKYAQLLLKDGADQVFIATHIYGHRMEPQLGNERLALDELLKRKIAHVHAGPDVWAATKEHYPKAFASDGRHPNELGAEIMAQKWFEALLKHDGLEAAN